MPLPYTEEQLNGMSNEELLAIKKQLAEPSQSPRKFSLGGAILGGLRTLGSQNLTPKATGEDLATWEAKERIKQSIGADPEKRALEIQGLQAGIAEREASTKKTNAELGILPKEMELREKHYSLEQQNIDLDKERIANDTTRTSWQKEKDLSDLNMRQRSLDLDREKFEQEKSTFGKKPEDIEREKKSGEESQMIVDTAQEMLDSVKEVKKGAKYFGPYGSAPSLLTSVGGIIDYGPRKKWEQYTQKLISGKIIELISRMKAVSKTGATGFGQLSEKEGQILKDAAVALSKDLMPKDAIEILNQMEEKLGKIVSGVNTQDYTELPSFATEQEAIASGQKGEVMIGGRRARID